MYRNDVDLCIGRVMEGEESIPLLGWLVEVRCLMPQAEQIRSYLGRGGGVGFMSFQELHDHGL